MGAKHVNSIATKNQQYAKFINDLSDGWEGVKARQKEYLPEQLSENDKVYNARHALATYLDSFNPTIDGINGLIFQQPISIETKQEYLKDFVGKATQDGKNFNKFVKEYFDTSLRKDLAFAYIDIPQGNSNVVTDTQRKELGIVPYVVLIQPENIINWKTTIVNGKKVLSQVTIKEVVEKDKNDFETEEQEQYRVLKIGSWELYDKDENFVDSGVNNLTRIPLVSLQLNGKEFMEAKPPFNDLGRLCIVNYQLMSDSRWSANTASIPFLHFAGFDKEELNDVVVSVNKGYASQDTDAKINYIDYEGKGVALNMSLMEKIDKRIAEIGMSVLSDKANVTATEKTLDSVQTQSKISNWVDSLTNSIHEIFNYVMMYYNQEADAEVNISSNILEIGITPEEMAKYSEMVAKGQLSNITLWEVLKSKGKLPKNFDMELEEERLQNELSMLTSEV